MKREIDVTIRCVLWVDSEIDYRYAMRSLREEAHPMLNGSSSDGIGCYSIRPIGKARARSARLGRLQGRRRPRARRDRAPLQGRRRARPQHGRWDVSFDVWLTAVRPTEVFSANITHNLNRMAQEAGIYSHLWRPEEIGIKTAGELVAPLKAGLALMRSDPARFRAFDAANGWGTYDDFVPWIAEYLAACEANPDAEVRVSR